MAFMSYGRRCTHRTRQCEGACAQRRRQKSHVQGALLAQRSLSGRAGLEGAPVLLGGHGLSVPHCIARVIAPSSIPRGFFTRNRIKGSNLPGGWPRANFLVNIEQVDCAPKKKKAPGVKFDENISHPLCLKKTCKCHVMIM